MTTSWNQFPIGKIESNDSTTQPVANSTITSNLNLTDLASRHTTAAKPDNSGNILDFGAGFAGGMGKQAWGTVTSLTGADAGKAMSNLQTGDNKGYGFLPVLGSFVGGLSKTVSVAIHNPDALMKLPGQIISNYQNGNMETKGDIAGQASFIIGSFFAGGAGATKGAKIAGDLSDVTTAAKGFDAIGQSAASLSKLEGAVGDINAASKLGDINALGDAGRIGRLGTDAVKLGAVGETTAIKGSTFDSSVSSILGKPGSWTERALPMENPTEFLSPTSRASTVGLSEGLSTRIMSNLRGAEGSTMSNLAARFTGVTENASSLATRIGQKLTPFGRQAEVLGTDIAPSVENLTANAARTGAESGVAKFGAGITNAGESGITKIHALSPIGETGVAGSGVLGEGTSLAGNAGKVDGLSGFKATGNAFESYLSKVTPHFDSVSEQANALRSSATTMEAKTAITDFETTFTRFKDATMRGSIDATERGLYMKQIDLQLAGLEKAGLDVTRIRQSVQLMNVEMDAAHAATIGASLAVTRMDPHFDALGTQTAALRSTASTAEASTAVGEFETSLTKFKTALTDGTMSTADKAQSFAQFDLQLAALDHAGLDTNGVRQAMTALRTETEVTQAAAQMKNVSTAAEALQVSAASKPVEVQTALQAVQDGSASLSGPLNATDRAAQLSSLERNMAIVDRSFGSEADALRTATSGLKVELETAQRAAQIETTVARLPEQAKVVGTALDGIETAAAAKGTEAAGAVTNLRQASSELASATTAAERSEQLAQIDRNMAVLERELGPNAALKSAVSDLTGSSQSIERMSQIEQAVAVVPAKASTVLEETAALRTASTSSVQTADVQTALTNIEKTTTELRQPLSAADRAEHMVQLERNMTAIENLGPEAAPLRNAVASLQTEVQTADRLARLETTVSSLPAKSEALTQEVGTLRQMSQGSTQIQGALDGIEQASAKLSKPLSVTEQAQAALQMDKNIALVEAKYGTEATVGLRTAATDLTTSAGTAERLSRLDATMQNIPEGFANVAKESSTLEAAAAVKGAHVSDALTAVRESATELAGNANTLNRAEQMAKLEQNFAVVDRELGSEAAGLRQSVFGVQNDLQTADRLTRFDTAVSEMTGKSQVLSEQIGTMRQLAAGSEPMQTALTNIEEASAKLSKPLTATEHAEALTALDKNVTLVEAKFGTDAVALRSAATEFGAGSATVERLSTLDTVVTSMPARFEAVATETAGLQVSAAAKGAHVSDALTAVREGTAELAAGNVANRTELMTRIESNMAVVDRELGSEAAGLKQSVLGMGNDVKVADRLAQIDVSATQATRQAENVSQQLSTLRTANSVVEGSQADIALKNLSAGADHVIAADGIGSAERMAQMRSDLAVVERTFGTEAAAPVRDAFLRMETESVGASRLVNVDQAMVQIADRSAAVAQDSLLLKAMRSGEGDVAVGSTAEKLAAAERSTQAAQAAGGLNDVAALKSVKAAEADTALANIEKNANILSTAANTTERAEQIAQMSRDLNIVEARFGTEATATLRDSMLKLENASFTADRLATADSAALQFVKHSEAVTAEAEVLATSSKATKVEAELAQLKQASVEAAATTNAAQRAEQVARMNDNLVAVEQQVGEKAAAGLRTSVARMEAESGTIDRLALVETTSSQVPAKAEALTQQLSALRATAHSADVEAALANVRQSAMEAASPANTLTRADQLSARAADLGVIEREMGMQAAGRIRTSLAELDRATAQAQAAQVELINYQGAKVTQGLGYVESAGNLGSYQQMVRLEQINHDVAVMKSVMQPDSQLAQQTARLESHLKAVDAVSNILAHPDVAHASVQELVSMLRSTDSSVATAAADRLVLKGKTEMVESPVTGLLTERQQLWQAQKHYATLNEEVQRSLFESGKLFGLQTSDATFKKLLADIAIATTGIGTALGNAGYNLNVMANAARDNVLAAQSDARAKQESDSRVQRDQASQAASQGSTTATGAASTVTAATAAGGNGTSSTRDASIVQDVARVSPGQMAADSTSGQAVFQNKDDARMAPAVQAFGTGAYKPSADYLGSNDFPTHGASWWWMQQHGGSPWGFARGPGAPPPQETTMPLIGPRIARARGSESNSGSDFIKIAQTQFIIPRVMDLANQNSLLVNPTIVARTGRGAIGQGGLGGHGRSWQNTVDWSSISRGTSDGRGHDRDLSDLEKNGEGSTVDANAGAAGANNDPNHLQTAALSAQVNDPNFGNQDPTTPHVVAANSQDDEQMIAKV